MFKTVIEHLLPEQIEQRSFEILDGELKKRGIVLPKEQEMITKRVIHTTADFEYTDTLTFSEGAVGIARELLKKGADIVTDTNMALSGIIRGHWPDWVERYIVIWQMKPLQNLPGSAEQRARLSAWK